MKYSRKDIKWKCQQHRSIKHCSCWRSDFCDKRSRGFWHFNINLRSHEMAYRCRIINVRHEECSCHKQYKQIYSRNFRRKKWFCIKWREKTWWRKWRYTCTWWNWNHLCYKNTFAPLTSISLYEFVYLNLRKNSYDGWDVGVDMDS